MRFSSWRWRERDPLWTREVRGRWRRPWTFLLLLVYACTLATLARVFYGSLVPQGDIEFSRFGLGLGAPLFWKFVACQIAGWMPLGILLGAPILSLERERGALTDYLLAGISAKGFVRAKWRSLMGFALVLVVAPLPIAALCFPLGGVSAWDFASANALCVSMALCSCAMGLSLSAKHKTVAGAWIEALKACLELFPLVCLLLFLVPMLPPLALLAAAALVALVPRLLLSRIEDEFEFLARHLEIDAPRLPDYQAPTSFSFGQNDKGERVPLLSPYAASGMNVEEVERGSVDPTPPSPFDLWLQHLVARNPLALRDLTLQLRAWRRFLEQSDSDPMPDFSLLPSLGAGAVLLMLGWFLPPLAPAFRFLFWLGVVGALVQIALLSANGFARERSGHMITQLQLSTLLPHEIVAAKAVVPLLLTARLWACPLLSIGIGCLALEPLSMLPKFLVAFALLIITSVLGNWMSLHLRHVTVIAAATLGVLLALLVVLPMIFQPLLFRAPAALEFWWLEPLRFLPRSGDETIGPSLRLLCWFVGLSLVLFGACCRRWTRTREETR